MTTFKLLIARGRIYRMPANDNKPQSRNLLQALEAVFMMIGGKRGPSIIK